MKVLWQINREDIERIRAFLEQYQDDPLVQHRRRTNLSLSKPPVPRDEFWRKLVSCLLTTQQRSGPDSAVTRFIETIPFPLGYELCLRQKDLHGFVHQTLADFGGIRFYNRLSDQIPENLKRLEGGLWEETIATLDALRQAQTVESERRAARFVDQNFVGFGPKQSRNLLQWLGLTCYEIPIDSRITRWLNDFGFPVHLSADALSDPAYYQFVSEGIQRLCEEASTYPCILDAAIFVSFD